jgi:general secretion pathway protein K
VAAGISTESKMFSIYADGVVPGYRKETRVRVHAVIDFRTAMPIGDPMQLMAQNGQANPQQSATQKTPKPGTDAANNVDPSTMSPEAIQAAMTSNPGGNIVYWRIE